MLRDRGIAVSLKLSSDTQAKRWRPRRFKSPVTFDHERDSTMPDAPVPLDPGLVQQFVGKAHGDLDYVRKALAEHPTFLNAATDWGGGDWETALGAAAHVGRRDIALHLIERGARVDIFAAAMLGWLDVVKAIVAQQPAAFTAPGPHGIPLLVHAKAGGDTAADVVAFLLSMAARG
jgi:hypothetical protein